MEQRAHTWIAVRAIALLEDHGRHPDLVKLLKPRAAAAAMGAWIPDLTDAKRGGAKTQHHVFKLLPYAGADRKRFVARKDELLDRLCGSPAVKELLALDRSLPASWWSAAYRADPPPGQHLANRAMGLDTSLRDLLILGSPAVDALVPGKVSFLAALDPNARTHEEQAAVYFFMLSHFLADACMPCHCDGRKLSGYGEGLHEELEKHWGKLLGPLWDAKKLPGVGAAELVKRAREADAQFGITFNAPVPEMAPHRDLWRETVDVCRASFALSAIMVPPGKYPYGEDEARAPFETVMGEVALLETVDRVVLHDAVVNTAMGWGSVWEAVSGKMVGNEEPASAPAKRTRRAKTTDA